MMQKQNRRSHIDDIVGLIDGILGPDDKGPTPGDLSRGYGFDQHRSIPRTDPNHTTTPTPAQIPLRSRSRQVPPAYRRVRGTLPSGQYSVHALRNLTYSQLVEHLGRAGYKPLANNTDIRRNRDGSIGIVLHRTEILRFSEEVAGYLTITIDTGGYETTTTKQRINALLPSGYGIYAKKYRWFLSTPDGDVPYVDGTRISVEL